METRGGQRDFIGFPSRSGSKARQKGIITTESGVIQQPSAVANRISLEVSSNSRTRWHPDC